jgi:hypothetical protein
MDNDYKIIETKLVKGRNIILDDFRIKRINEAISFESGTIKNQKKTIVSKLPNNKNVFFLKPGKEAI